MYVPNNQRKGGTGLNINEIVKREEKWLKENPKKQFAPNYPNMGRGDSLLN